MVKKSELTQTLDTVTGLASTASEQSLHREKFPDVLAAMWRLNHQVERATRLVVREMRSDGYTWQEIADKLAITRQSAHSTYGP